MKLYIWSSLKKKKKLEVPKDTFVVSETDTVREVLSRIETFCKERKDLEIEGGAKIRAWCTTKIHDVKYGVQYVLGGFDKTIPPPFLKNVSTVDIALRNFYGPLYKVPEQVNLEGTTWATIEKILLDDAPTERVQWLHGCYKSSIRGDTEIFFPGNPYEDSQNIDRSGMTLVSYRDHLYSTLDVVESNGIHVAFGDGDEFDDYFPIEKGALELLDDRKRKEKSIAASAHAKEFEKHMPCFIRSMMVDVIAKDLQSISYRSVFNKINCDNILQAVSYTDRRGSSVYKVIGRLKEDSDWIFRDEENLEYVINGQTKRTTKDEKLNMYLYLKIPSLEENILIRLIFVSNGSYKIMLMVPGDVLLNMFEVDNILKSGVLPVVERVLQCHRILPYGRQLYIPVPNIMELERCTQMASPYKIGLGTIVLDFRDMGITMYKIKYDQLVRYISKMLYMKLVGVKKTSSLIKLEYMNAGECKGIDDKDRHSLIYSMLYKKSDVLKKIVNLDFSNLLRNRENILVVIDLVNYHITIRGRYVNLMHLDVVARCVRTSLLLSSGKLKEMHGIVNKFETMLEKNAESLLKKNSDDGDDFPDYDNEYLDEGDGDGDGDEGESEDEGESDEEEDKTFGSIHNPFAFGGGKGEDEGEDEGDKKTPNYSFIKKLYEADARLFKERAPGEKNYASVCQRSSMRQPVVVNNKDMKRIEEKYRDRYTYSYRNGSTKKKREMNSYLCPKFWCPVNKVPMLKGNMPCPKVHYKSVEEMPIKVTGKNNELNVPYALQYRTIASPCCHVYKDSKKREIEDLLTKPGEKEEDEDEDEEKEKEKKEKENGEFMLGYVRNISNAMDVLQNKQIGTLPKDIFNYLRNDKHCVTGGTKNKKDCFMRIGVSKPYEIATFLDCMAAYYRVAFMPFKHMTHLYFASGQELGEYIADNIPPLSFLLLNGGNTFRKFRSMGKRGVDEEGFIRWLDKNKEYVERMNLNDLLDGKKKGTRRWWNHHDVYVSMERFGEYMRDKHTNKNHHDLLDLFSPHKESDWITGERSITYIVIGIDENEKSWLSCPKYVSTRRTVSANYIGLIYYNRICYEPIVYTASEKIVQKDYIRPAFNFHPTGSDAMSMLLYQYKYMCHDDGTDYEKAKKVMNTLLENEYMIMTLIMDAMSFKIIGVYLKCDVFVPFPRAVSNRLILDVNSMVKLEFYSDVEYNEMDKKNIRKVFHLLSKIDKEFYEMETMKDKDKDIIGYYVGRKKYMLWLKGKVPKNKEVEEIESENENGNENENDIDIESDMLMKMKRQFSEAMTDEDMKLLEAYRHHMNPLSRQHMFNKTLGVIKKRIGTVNRNIQLILADHIMIKGIAGLYDDIDELVLKEDELYLSEDDIISGDYRKKLLIWEGNPFVRDSWEDNVRYVEFNEYENIVEDVDYKQFMKVLKETKINSAVLRSDEEGLEDFIKEWGGEMTTMYPLSTWNNMLPYMKYMKLSHKSYTYGHFVRIFAHVAIVLGLSDTFNEEILRVQVNTLMRLKYESLKDNENEWNTFVENVMMVNPSLKSKSNDVEDIIKAMKKVSYKPSVLEIQVVSNILGVHIIVVGGKKEYSMVGKNGYWVASAEKPSGGSKKYFVFLQYNCTKKLNKSDTISKDCMSLFPVVYNEKRMVLNHSDIKQDTLKLLYETF